MNLFKQCPKCGLWLSDKMLLGGIDIEPIGMCLDEDDMDFNFYYFNHDIPDCGTTFVVRVEELRHHLSGILPAIKMTGGQLCEGRCLNIEDHEICSQGCYYAPYRVLLRLLRDNRKARKLQASVQNLSTDCQG